MRRYIPEFIVLVYAVLFLFTKNPSNEWDRVIVSDGKGYYAYLSALFIYHDTDYGFIDEYESKYYPASRQLHKDYRFESGNGIVNKYFPGPAVLWLPFFGAGHVVAALFGFATDGYSLPYQMAIAFAAFFYFWLALLILRRILRFYTQNENNIAWTLLATALATNLVYYTVNSGCQVHVYNFFLINAFVYAILSACKNGKAAYFAASAFMLGMIIISRPQNGLIVLALPFLCGSRESFVLFFKKAFTELRILIPSAIALLLPLLVPLTYWYAKTGHFLVYAYGTESYDLTKPHLLSFLFSFEKGWMLYTPVAAIACIGLIYLFRKSKWQFASLSTFLFFLVYFLSSWWVWTYTSYISQRVMIDYYALLAILLIFIFKLLKNNRIRIILPVILTALIVLNLMQHFQQMIWVYPAGPVSAKSYFANFFSFSKGTTFVIPDAEILGKQSFIPDSESGKSLFKTSGLNLSKKSHTGNTAWILDSISNVKSIFIRGLSDYKEISPVILKISGWYFPETTDSVLTMEVSVGNYKEKYSISQHNLMTGLVAGRWKYAEMAVYLPYLRSVSDSLFITVQNRSHGSVLLDDMQVELLKMQGPLHHDWILAADEQVDSATLFHTDMETKLDTPWSNAASIASAKAFSGKKASSIQSSSPYSLVFEKEMDFGKESDGYLRVSSRILGDSLSEVMLVFDFTSNGKTVYYKTYPVHVKANNRWIVSEIFREFPVTRLKAGKVKIYYWYIKGSDPVYIDDMQVDFVMYKKLEIIKQPTFAANTDAKTINSVCCDFEKECLPESGKTEETAAAYSGTKVCMVNAKQPFSFSHLMPLQDLQPGENNFVYVTAKVNSDQYTTSSTLVVDFRHNGKSVSYNPGYLRNQTSKGIWNSIDFGIEVPEGITAKDSVLVYFYLSKEDEEMMIDDFCVNLKKTTSIVKKNKK